MLFQILSKKALNFSSIEVKRHFPFSFKKILHHDFKIFKMHKKLYARKMKMDKYAEKLKKESNKYYVKIDNTHSDTSCSQRKGKNKDLFSGDL